MTACETQAFFTRLALSPMGFVMEHFYFSLEIALATLGLSCEFSREFFQRNNL